MGVAAKQQPGDGIVKQDMVRERQSQLPLNDHLLREEIADGWSRRDFRLHKVSIHV